MYDTADAPRGSGRQRERLIKPDPAVPARQTLARVRKMFDAFVSGVPCDAERLRASINVPMAAPAHEAERLLACARLCWMTGAFTEAAGLLERSDDLCKAGPEAPPASAELPAIETALLATHVAGWRARVRLLLCDTAAVADYETALRRLGGQPRATAYYADLLWRQGRVDRAEQVWKSLRTNKRVLACDEAPLLEARFALRRGELGAAERMLREATIAGGPAIAERHLLFAWLFASQRKADGAREALDAAARGIYPPTALRQWRDAVEAKLAGEEMPTASLSQAWQAFFTAQRHRAEGGEAEAVYREAMTCAAVAPFARYGLTCLGVEDAGLEAQTDAFFGSRARLRVMLDRFRRYDLSPAELTAALQQAARDGVEDVSLAHYGYLAKVLGENTPVDELCRHLSELPADARSRNVLRLCLLLCDKQPLSSDTLHLLRSIDLPELAADVLRVVVRTALRNNDVETMRTVTDARFAVARAMALGDAFTEASSAAEVERALNAGRRPLPDMPEYPELIPALSAKLAERTSGDAAPPGVDANAWHLHLAARALQRGDVTAGERHLLLANHPLAETIRPQSDAAHLAAALEYPPPASQDLAGLLRTIPEGAYLLVAARRGERENVVVGVQRLVGAPHTPTRLQHHLALWSLRRAERLDEQGSAMAVSFHQDAWRALLPALDDPATIPTEAGDILVSHLLDRHRRRISDALRHGDTGTARAIFRLVTDLTNGGDRFLAGVKLFQERLTTEGLTSSREAQQLGEIPQGWKSNHEAGVAVLLRRLALDGDNPRLLVALMEACNAWFLDLYHLQHFDRIAGELGRIAEHVEALHDRLRGDSGDDAARAAMSDILKVRGFLAGDTRGKRADYAEALRLHPGNTNARNLLADLDASSSTSGGGE